VQTGSERGSEEYFELLVAAIAPFPRQETLNFARDLRDLGCALYRPRIRISDNSGAHWKRKFGVRLDVRLLPGTGKKQRFAVPAAWVSMRILAGVIIDTKNIHDDWSILTMSIEHSTRL